MQKRKDGSVRPQDAEDSFRIWLEGADGAEREFELVGTFFAEGTDYAALHPMDSKDGEVILLTVEEDDDGGPAFFPIEDETEYRNAGQIFEALFNGEAEIEEIPADSETEETQEDAETEEWEGTAEPAEPEREDAEDE